MKNSRHSISILATAVFLLLPAGCDREPTPEPPREAETPISNRVEIPASVRQNLGITFAKVESRPVARTLRVPGRFELPPTARREYRAQAPGRVELLVTQFQTVQPGTPLYRIDSPRWREMQKELADAHAAVRLAQASADSIGPLFDAHEKHHAEIQEAVDLWTNRVESLEQLRAAGGAAGDEVAAARAALASARSDLAETLEKEADLAARQQESAAALEAARSRLVFLFEAASSLTGLSAAELREAAIPPGGTEPAARWAALDTIEVRAITPGVIDSLHAVSGGVVDEHAAILTAVQPELVRFRAVGLQSDLPRLADGQPAVVVAAQDSAPSATIPGVLALAPTADPERRTVDLILTPRPGIDPPAWARAGVAAFLEVTTSGTSGEELAIPLRCVARDGARAVIFRRDPADPDKAIRLEADLGLDDGRWVVIKSGVAEGNEVVLDGVYQLMVATSGGVPRGGHFHPDGTFHDEAD